MDQYDSIGQAELFKNCIVVDLCSVADTVIKALYRHVIKALEGDGIKLNCNDWWGLLEYARSLGDEVFSEFEKIDAVYMNIHTCPSVDDLEYIAGFDIRLDDELNPCINGDDPHLLTIADDIYTHISDNLDDNTEAW